MMRCFVPLFAMGDFRAMGDLEILAIASINGTADDSYHYYRDIGRSVGGGQDGPDTCAQLFQRLLATSPKLAHVCHRQAKAPLSLPKSAHPSSLHGRFSRTIHVGGTYEGQPTGRDFPHPDWSGEDILPRVLDIPLNDKITIPLGAPVRLYSDFEPSKPFPELAYYMEGTVLDAVGDNPWAGRMDFAALDVEVFGSTAIWDTYTSELEFSTDILETLGLPHNEEGYNQDYVLTTEQQRLLSEIKGKALQKEARENGGKYHSVRWYSSADTPPCAACGSVLPM